ncbi:MAG: RNA-binding protein [Helicobacteraceae bacterium]|jgi:RNA recognition motif-containing protein|nr:RNA-binding protein [Helicobacteraceae bacterium]
MKQLYVGNLPYQATENEIKAVFAAHGEVSAVRMMNDRETGRFRGFCFVEMEDSGAQKAIDALNDQDFGGRKLRVNEAREREARPPRREQRW